MPPASSQKGTGKKGGAAAVRQQPRSRNTTPSSVPPAASLPPIETQETETLELRFDVFRNLTYEDLVDSGASTAIIPDSKALDGIVTRLQRLGESIEKRGNYCDRGMRLLAANRRTRMDEMAAEGRREDERRQREAEDEERERKANKKKRKATENLASSGSNAGQLIHLHPRVLAWSLPTSHSLPAAFFSGFFELDHQVFLIASRYTSPTRSSFNWTVTQIPSPSEPFTIPPAKLN
jgi:hypothetical protein